MRDAASLPNRRNRDKNWDKSIAARGARPAIARSTQEPIMCVTLMFKLFGASLLIQGCASGDPAALPQKVAPPPPPITTEDWAPIVAKADAEEDGSITYLFRDMGGRVRPAVAACGDDIPKEDTGKVMITMVQHKNLIVYSVACTEPPKVT